MAKKNKTLFVICTLGLVLSTGAFIQSAFTYSILGHHESIASALTPPNRDHVSATVAPMIEGHEKAETALKFIKGRHDESMMFHENWHSSVQHSRTQARNHAVLWAITFFLFLGILFFTTKDKR